MRDKKGRFTKKVSGIEGLPEKWCINRQNHPEVQKWFNDNALTGANYDQYLRGWMTCYPAIPSGNHSVLSTPPGYKEITVEQFRKYVLKQDEEFVLPKKWCIKSGDRSVVDYCNKYGAKPPYGEIECNNNYCHFPATNNNRATTLSDIQPGYTEITLEQFKKYVLKQKEMKDKKIIGYNFKPSMKQYEQAALTIAQIPDWNRFNPHLTSDRCITLLKSAAVLDIWFDPVYEKEYPRINIGGYDAKFNEDEAYVRFGCQRFTKGDVIVFGDILMRSGLRIDQWNDEVFKVYDYFKGKS